MPNTRLGHILLTQGLIDDQKLDFCLNVQKNNGGEPIGKVLKHYGFINDGHIAKALAVQAGWETYIGSFDLDDDMLALFGLSFFLEHVIFPARTDSGVKFVLSRTEDMALIDSIQSRLNGKACFAVAVELDLRQALEQVSLREHGFTGKNSNAIEDDLVAWLEGHLNFAMVKNATDIHIEPSQKAVEVRIRVDGILHFLDSLRLEQLPRLINVIFHKSDVTISDFGHCHDARFTHRYLNRAIDVRVSHIPAVHGSSIVLRLLDKGKTVATLTDLGYGQEQWDMIQADLIKPEGLTLIVGPTGCGKSTTLYALLNHLKSISRKIVTIEDPVEMQMSLMTQVQTQEKRSITFGSAVRAFLRHDPNIILIGEIRDQETAQEAIRAAMTGHKVFATVHANRPIDAILRLNDLGVAYTHMAGNLNMIITQRLLRRLCPLCKAKQGFTRSMAAVHERKYFLDEEQEISTAVGCNQCQSGYLGRTIVAESLTVHQDVESLIGEGNIMGLRQHLNLEKKYTAMLDDARRLISEGITSISEAVRVLG